MAEWIEKLKSTPWVAHVLEAMERFGTRLGAQFAAAITYFSVLSIVPVLMVAFAALGLTLTVFVPDVLDQVKAWITDAVSGRGDLGDQLTAAIDQAFGSWQAVGIVGLLSAMWSGANWVNNIRSAVRGMMRPDFDMTQAKSNIVVQTLKNLAILFGLFILVALTMAMTTIATTARDLVRLLLGLDRVPTADALLAVVPLVGTLLAGFAMFAFLFRVFPERKVPLKVLLVGAVIGAVGMAALQYAAGLLVSVFAGNAAAAVFGSVIVVMLYFNLFATLILIVAAWIGTHPEFVGREQTLADVVPQQPTDYATKKLAAELASTDAGTVPEAVAIRAARVGMGAGALAGAAVAGLAAAVASVISGWRERR
ncbi:MAG: YihY/virulence factor BrkB family protein [Actinomycetes bacterium]